MLYVKELYSDPCITPYGDVHNITTHQQYIISAVIIAKASGESVPFEVDGLWTLEDLSERIEMFLGVPRGKFVLSTESCEMLLGSKCNLLEWGLNDKQNTIIADEGAPKTSSTKDYLRLRTYLYTVCLDTVPVDECGIDFISVPFMPTSPSCKSHPSIFVIPRESTARDDWTWEIQCGDDVDGDDVLTAIADAYRLPKSCIKLLNFDLEPWNLNNAKDDGRVVVLVYGVRVDNKIRVLEIPWNVLDLSDVMVWDGKGVIKHTLVVYAKSLVDICQRLNVQLDDKTVYATSKYREQRCSQFNDVMAIDVPPPPLSIPNRLVLSVAGAVSPFYADIHDSDDIDIDDVMCHKYFRDISAQAHPRYVEKSLKIQYKRASNSAVAINNDEGVQ